MPQVCRNVKTPHSKALEERHLDRHDAPIESTSGKQLNVRFNSDDVTDLSPLWGFDEGRLDAAIHLSPLWGLARR